MARKDKIADSDLDVDLDAELDEVAVIEAGAPRTRGGGGGGLTISPELANALKRKCDDIPKDKKLRVEKSWLNEKVGLDPDKEMGRGDPNTLKRKFNRQHGDLAGAGRIWHVGNMEDYKYYTFAFVDADQDEEDKWKKPKPKKSKTGEEA